MSSMEIRRTPDGTDFECDWGVFVNSEVNPRRECGIQPLMLITRDVVARILRGRGAEPSVYGVGTVGATIRRGVKMAYLDDGVNRWAWRLYEAHWWDGVEHPSIMVGRWPD